jgi:hypothetical protein
VKAVVRDGHVSDGGVVLLWTSDMVGMAMMVVARRKVIENHVRCILNAIRVGAMEEACIAL